MIMSNATHCAVEGELYSDDEDKRLEDQRPEQDIVLGTLPFSGLSILILLIFFLLYSTYTG